ncbi:MAG: helix-turn-helix domain-containing protein [Chloroflexi bacterium]|nr:helix-turn-helix domain-containing protein [Chloroflexota bacterium]
MIDEFNSQSNLDGKQEKALEMILQGEKDVAIAERLGINRTTIYRWRKHDSEFMEALDERQTLMREAARQGLMDLMDTALETVKEALSNGDSRTRLQAARMVLDMLNVKKQEEKKEPSVIDLLYEALVGVEDKLGIGTGNNAIDISQK